MKLKKECLATASQITKNTSNQHTNHIITNILVCMNCEEKKVINTIQIQESEVSKLAQALPPKQNTVIPGLRIALHTTKHT